MANQRLNLPPGFRFHPTDEELVVHYLGKKLASLPLPAPVIADVNIYKFDPWELPDKAVFGEKEWYYFSPRDRKYPNGVRPNRAALSGYWKATGTDKVIANSKTGERIGIRKVLVFYKGKPPRGVKTGWIMHEFRLADMFRFNHYNQLSPPQLEEWVLCRIYHKPNITPATPPTAASSNNFSEESPIGEPSRPKALKKSVNTCSFSNLLDTVDLQFLRRILQEENIADSPPTFPPSTPPANTTNHSPATLHPVPNTETGLKREPCTGDTGIPGNPPKRFAYCYHGSTMDPRPRALCTSSSPFLQF